jgi:hypothetical protein
MMHGRAPVVAERQIDEADRRGGRGQCSAQ